MAFSPGECFHIHVGSQRVRTMWKWEAFLLIDEMLSRGLRPDAFVYSSAIQTLERRRWGLVMASELIEAMEARAVQFRFPGKKRHELGHHIKPLQR
jgi:hypothetical protein